MFTPEPPLRFQPADQPLADRLIRIAAETDRIEGYAQPHAIAVARLAEAIAIRLDVSGHDLTSLKLAALAHDIGERRMKRNYLLRDQPLTWEETLDLWRHPILGEQEASELRLPRLAQLLIRWHHESWNGLGYPDGLAGEAIPLGARILRVVDCFCALTSDRPYRAALDPFDAEDVISDRAGIDFDPLVVEVLLDYLDQQVEEGEEQIESLIAENTTFVSEENGAELADELTAELAAELADETGPLPGEEPPEIEEEPSENIDPLPPQPPVDQKPASEAPTAASAAAEAVVEAAVEDERVAEDSPEQAPTEKSNESTD